MVNGIYAEVFRLRHNIKSDKVHSKRYISKFMIKSIVSVVYIKVYDTQQKCN